MLFPNQPLFEMPEGIETRWATCENPDGLRAGATAGNGRKSAPCCNLAAGESRVLAHAEECSGMIRRIWITIPERDPERVRGIRLDFFWDGCDKPAVSAPIGDFFGVGLGRMAAFECALFSNPEGRSFTCVIPMPFRTGMKLVVTNETARAVEGFFYEVDYTLGDAFTDDTLYFHAHFRRENPTQMLCDYTILPRVTGRGRYLGVNVGVRADKRAYFNTWWGEGEVKIYLDGDDEHPTLCGTGTEDYIGTGWGQGKYANLYQGCPVAEWESLSYCFYRYHIPDPVYFRSDCRVTIQQMGCYSPNDHANMLNNRVTWRDAQGQTIAPSLGMTPPYGLFERADDWSSCAYFYLDAPANALPQLMRLADRMPQV